RVPVVQEDNGMLDAESVRRRLRLALAHLCQLLTGDFRITGVANLAVGDQTVVNVTALAGPARDRAAAGELAVVWVRHANQHALGCRRLLLALGHCSLSSQCVSCSCGRVIPFAGAKTATSAAQRSRSLPISPKPASSNAWWAGSLSQRLTPEGCGSGTSTT